MTDHQAAACAVTRTEVSIGSPCDWDKAPDPCGIVIFGASGDLTLRKLLPSLYNLYRHGGLPNCFYVLGAARTEMSDDAFRDKMREGILTSGFEMDGWEDFAQHLHYQTLHYDQRDSYADLGRMAESLDVLHQTGGRRIYNLAIPPNLYREVVERMGEAGLCREYPEQGVWARLVIEKPFGTDLATAQRLNLSIGRSFREHQVFRIDHYLAKDTVQNILILRFANTIFEPLWNRNYIDHVRINASESLGVEHRSGYYEQAGVLRDMFQNHMMQLLALVASEPPSKFSADRVRDAKAEIFRSLRPLPLDRLDDHLILGQYAVGQMDGQVVPGYREEPGVSRESLTPTYALIRVFVDNWRWQGVPFYISSGKRLRRKVTRIDVQFKEVPHSLFRDMIGVDIRANRLVMGIHPDQDIFLNLQTKRPGQKICLRTVGLNFMYHLDGDGPKLDAYEKALTDVMAGDQTLFWRQDMLELCWSYFDPILGSCELCSDRQARLHPYPAGSHGPQAALDLLPPGSWPEKP